jgi:hypothetical protein
MEAKQNQTLNAPNSPLKDKESEKTPEKTPFQVEMDRQKSLQTPEQRENLELLDKIGCILKDYGGIESNIPLTHEYWALQGQYRAATKK